MNLVIKSVARLSVCDPCRICPSVAPGTLQVYATYIYPAIYHLQTGPSHGSLTFHANGSFTYTPNQCFVGSDSFTFTWTDGISTGNTATVWINVYNNAPVASDAYYTILHDTELTGQVYGYDPDGDAITAHLVSGTSQGTLDFRPDGSFIYTPNERCIGTDTFTFRWLDGAANSNVATVHIIVFNNAPVAQDDIYTDQDLQYPHFEEDTDYQLPDDGWLTARVSFLENDGDPDGDSIYLTGVIQGLSFGEVEWYSNGTFRYRPTHPLDSRPAVDTFVYQITDGINWALGQVTVLLTQPYLAPKGPKKSGKPAPDVPAVLVAGRGYYDIPAGSVVFVTNNAPFRAYWAIRWNAPTSTPIYTGIASWADVVAQLGNVPNGSLPAIVLDGHGGDGGVKTQDENQWLVARTLTNTDAAFIRSKLRNDGLIIGLVAARLLD
ncbi:MAG: Ig-like domain-containing protein [Gemmatales bacterium]|nr:Ig-like domain-containing protein [Gemmatales bacterium]